MPARLMLVTGATVVASICAIAAAVVSQREARTFQTGITGSAPSGPGNPTAMMSTPAVRQVLLDLAEGAIAIADANRRLAGSPYDVPAIVEAGLARIDAGALRLALNYVSADDQRLMSEKARAYGRELADLVLARRPELEAAVAPLAATAEERRAILFFLVGCMALDWDGLAYTERAGYRASATVTGPGFAYTPWMKENAADVSRRGLYWGSHNRAAGDYTFTTFGDHEALPRLAFPDLFFSLGNPFSTLETAAATRAGRAIVSAYSATVLSDISGVLLAIDDGAPTIERIAELSDVRGPMLTSVLSLLEQIDYVQRADDGYTHRITVLKESAGPAATRVVTLVRDAMEVWHKRRASEVQRDLAGLTAIEQGVPFDVLYTEIWHYVFGYANLSLAERGLIADPYADSAPFRGFLPVLWATTIDASS
jgi:hypothetical protein